MSEVGVVAPRRPSRSSRTKAAHRGIRGVNAIILLVHAVSLGMFSFIAFGYRWFGLDEHTLFYPFCWVFLCLAVWALISWRIVSGTLFDLYGIFFFAAVLFTGGHAILEVFGLNPTGFLSNQFPPETEFRTLRLVIICLGALHLGALVRALFVKPPRHITYIQADAVNESPIASAMAIVGWGLFLVSLLPSLMIALDAVQTVLASGYMALYVREESYGLAAGPMILANFLAPSAILIMLGSRGNKYVLVLSWMLILGFAALQFFLGYRSSAVMPLLGFAWAYDQKIRRIPRGVLLAAGSVLLFVVFPLIRVVRDVAGGSRLSPRYLWDSFVGIDNPLIAIVWELGTVMNTIAHTIELVPTYTDFFRGASYAYSLTSAMPNLFWDVHPAAVNADLAAWLVWQVDPGTAARGGGMGYSFIAEAYSNFGTIGSVLFTLLLGFAFASVVFFVSGHRSVLRVAAVGAALCFLPFYARGQALDIVRSVTWYVLVPLLMVIMVVSLARLSVPPKKLHSSRAVGSDGRKAGLLEW